MSELVPEQVVDDRYRLIKRIGSGGMADVWLAEDTGLGRHVALKVLYRRFAQDAEFVARFRREAEAAASLQHPNVVRVFDRGQVGDTYYIAMEYLSGHTLRELIDFGLTPGESCAIVRQVLEAASYAHRHGVIHRDFKPSNVIVDVEGHATVTDFGIARAGVSEITQTGSVMGTAHYLPPEQAQGLAVTAKSDLYSIGVILYEALTGRVPFEGDTAITVALKQVSEAAQRPSSFNPAVSPALDAAVMRALEKDPDRRYASAEAFVAALDAAQRDPSLSGPDTAAFAPLPPTEVEDADAAEAACKRRKRLIIAGIIAAILLGIFAGYALSRETRTDVPNVINQTLATASQRLLSSGFEFDTSYVESSAVRDTVLEQDPAPGTHQMKCSFLHLGCKKPTVTLTVSAGPGDGTVAKVAGLPKAEAIDKLEQRGFNVAVATQNSSTFGAGIAITTDPKPGTTLARGETVTLKVSKGPKSINVPALIGVQLDVAEARLRARGLVPSSTSTQSSKPAGEVISQSPGPGESAQGGDTVTMVVSAGEAKVTVPDEVGNARPDAVTALRGLGLNVTVSERETSDITERNFVLQQSVAPGVSVPVGSGITLVVGRYIAPTPIPPGTTTTP